LIRDALISFTTDTTIGSFVGLTNYGGYGGIAYRVKISPTNFKGECEE
jgi:hypothetical protein